MYYKPRNSEISIIRLRLCLRLCRRLSVCAADCGQIQLASSASEQDSQVTSLSWQHEHTRGDTTQGKTLENWPAAFFLVACNMDNVSWVLHRMNTMHASGTSTLRPASPGLHPNPRPQHAKPDYHQRPVSLLGSSSRNLCPHPQNTLKLGGRCNVNIGECVHCVWALRIASHTEPSPVQEQQHCQQNQLPACAPSPAPPWLVSCLHAAHSLPPVWRPAGCCCARRNRCFLAQLGSWP